MNATTATIIACGHVCPDCGQEFRRPVWHCGRCAVHNPATVDVCRGCGCMRHDIAADAADADDDQ